MVEKMKPTFGRPKTKEELQAQIENFAEKKLASVYTGDDKDDKEYFENREKALPVFKTSSDLASITNVDKLREDSPEELKELVTKHKDAYLLSLKEQGIAKLKFQAECIARYDKEFDSIVKNLRLQLSKVTTGKELQAIEGYVSSGFEGHVFKIQTPSGIYAIKLFKGISDQQLEAMRKAKDVPNVAHLVAYSQKDKAIIMDFLEGKNLKYITKQEKPEITDSELKSILTTCVDLFKRGVRLDPIGNNFMFDKEKGFTAIDYHTMIKSYNLKKAIEGLSEAISKRADFTYSDEYYNEVIETNSRMIKQLKENFPEFYNENKKQFEKSRFDSLKTKIKKLFE